SDGRPGAASKRELMREGDKIADAVLDKVKQFTIGFALAGEKPAAKGSGVLIKYGDLHGILTCAHVDDEQLRALKRPVGLLRLNRGPAEQFGMLHMDEVDSYVAGKEPWPREARTSPSFTRRRTSWEILQRTAYSSTPRRTSRSPSPTTRR